MKPLKPTPEGFVAYLRTVVGVPDTAITDDSPWIGAAYCAGLEIVNVEMGLEQLPLIYTTTVYNAASSILINYAPDTPPSTWFDDMREKFKLMEPVTGLVNAASDQGTSGSIVISDAMSNLTLQNLMMMRDPFGRAALAVLMDLGPTVWGYTR